MSAHIIIVENSKDWRQGFPGNIVISAKDYIAQHDYLKLKNLKVINLCRSYKYLTVGYYVSLLAEARLHKVIPSVRTILDLSSRSIYGLDIGDLDEVVQKSLARRNTDEGSYTDRFELYVFFGNADNEALQEIAREIFESFPCPLLKVEFRLQGRWHISKINAIQIHTLEKFQEEGFLQGLNAYVAKRWQEPKSRSIARYDLAILHNSQEKHPPSNRRALQNFMRVGKKLGLDVELIEKKDYSKLAEYDALFIRETTSLHHHTYRFARKALSEGMVVIDDPDSILKCTNKVYLAELLKSHRVSIPKTVIVHKTQLDTLEAELSYPVVLKIPDGSFSRGVVKADDPQQIREYTRTLFKDSDIVLAQEFLPTEFDWRIAVLNRTPLFACQYFMSEKHWQIYKHGPSGIMQEGAFKTLPIEEAPDPVVKVARRAANLIGDGLYGVDIKETERGVYVIEINDNPNLDAGIEDAYLKGDLYRIVLEEFIRRLEKLRGR